MTFQTAWGSFSSLILNDFSSYLFNVYLKINQLLTNCFRFQRKIVCQVSCWQRFCGTHTHLSSVEILGKSKKRWESNPFLKLIFGLLTKENARIIVKYSTSFYALRYMNGDGLNPVSVQSVLTSLLITTFDLLKHFAFRKISFKQK